MPEPDSSLIDVLASLSVSLSMFNRRSWRFDGAARKVTGEIASARADAGIRPRSEAILPELGLPPEDVCFTLTDLHMSSARQLQVATRLVLFEQDIVVGMISHAAGPADRLVQAGLTSM